MPDRTGGFTPIESLPLDERLAIDRDWQAHWYRHIGQLAAPRSVFDAGAGTGYGLSILRAAGCAQVAGFDVVDIGPEVVKASIADYGRGSWDWVIAVDVIEHIQNDKLFLENLLRVAREGVFITTPNWNVSQAENVYHVREYTPLELQELIESTIRADRASSYRIWVSNHKLEITTREVFDAAETWHNHGVLIEKR